MSAHAGFEVAIGGGDEPHVGVDDLLAADARELAVLDTCSSLACSRSGISPISSSMSVP